MAKPSLRLSEHGMIKYLGSKRVLIPQIVGLIDSIPGVRSVADLFSGTSRVGHALKARGYQVMANDHLAYAHALATCYVQADRDELASEAQSLIDELNRLPGEPGYVTETFCVRSRFFQPRNGERIDAIRERIERLDLTPELRAVLLVSLMEAADRVDSTTGVQMAYLKSWAPRASNHIELRLPDMLVRAAAGKGAATQRDAIEAAGAISADVVYLDPPYNQHSYLGNYHIWESLVRWDKPDVYGVACKRTDCRTRKSPFNRKREALPAFRRLIDAVDAPNIVVSFNDEGFIDREQLSEALMERGRLHVIERDHPRYVGARIGIHNPRGERVGTVGRLRNTELLFVVVPHASAWEPDPALVAAA